MSTTRPILADNAICISELKKNPMAVIDEAGGFPVAVLNRNQPVFYCVPADAYEALMDNLDDIVLAQIVSKREDQDEVEIHLDNL